MISLHNCLALYMTVCSGDRQPNWEFRLLRERVRSKGPLVSFSSGYPGQGENHQRLCDVGIEIDPSHSLEQGQIALGVNAFPERTHLSMVAGLRR